MSYQFEDESALEELLNQQLDRRKPVTSRKMKAIDSLPSAREKTQPTGALVDRTSGQDESTLGESSIERQSKGKMANWLAAGTSADYQISQPVSTNRNTGTGASSSKVPTTEQEFADRKSRGSLMGKAQATRADDPWPGQSDLGDVDELLIESKLQEMSKQRLIQLIVEKVKPAVANLRLESSRRVKKEIEQLENELLNERARLQMVELRCEERIKLEEQKWSQLSGQLEARLAMSDRELIKMMETQREHSEKLSEQHQRNLHKITENYEQRLEDERRRLTEDLRMRDELHKLELESKLNVNFDLSKMEAVQAEWRRSLEMTISQLNDQFRSIESLLDKQAHQINGTSVDLEKRTRLLCEQYDKFEDCRKELSSSAGQLCELMPKFSRFQQTGESMLSQAAVQLAQLSERSSAIQEERSSLDKRQSELEQTSEQLHSDRLQLSLDSSRVQLKEERLDELIKSNSECEVKLCEQRIAQIEEQAHLQTKRTHLDEKANELREQNYSLHLMRKRITAQKEDIIKARLELEVDRKNASNDKATIHEESTKLEELRARVQREVDQLARLQRSLVCSLCMGRLFGRNNSNGVNNNNQSVEMLMKNLTGPSHANINEQCKSLIVAPKIANEDIFVGLRSSSDKVHEGGDIGYEQPADLLQVHKLIVGHNAGLLAKESRYAELLSSTTN